MALVAQQRSYKTLERLCTVVADRIIEEFGAEAVWVKAAKPEPPIPLTGRGGLGRGLARAAGVRRPRLLTEADLRDMARHP